MTSPGWRWWPAPHASRTPLVTLPFLKNRVGLGWRGDRGLDTMRRNGKSTLVLFYLVNFESDGSCKQRLKSRPTVTERLRWQSPSQSSPALQLSSTRWLMKVAPIGFQYFKPVFSWMGFRQGDMGSAGHWWSQLITGNSQGSRSCAFWFTIPASSTHPSSHPA